jgi:hypothetical protein
MCERMLYDLVKLFTTNLRGFLHIYLFLFLLQRQLNMKAVTYVFRHQVSLLKV